MSHHVTALFSCLKPPGLQSSSPDPLSTDLYLHHFPVVHPRCPSYCKVLDQSIFAWFYLISNSFCKGMRTSARSFFAAIYGDPCWPNNNCTYLDQINVDHRIHSWLLEDHRSRRGLSVCGFNLTLWYLNHSSLSGCNKLLWMNSTIFYIYLWQKS